MKAEELGALDDSLSLHLVALKRSGPYTCVAFRVVKLGRRSHLRSNQTLKTRNLHGLPCILSAISALHIRTERTGQKFATY